MTRRLTMIAVGLIVTTGSAEAQVVKYTDEHGITHYVGSESQIPEKYRTNATQPTLPSVTRSIDPGKGKLLEADRLLRQTGRHQLEQLKDAIKDAEQVDPADREAFKDATQNLKERRRDVQDTADKVKDVQRRYREAR